MFGWCRLLLFVLALIDKNIEEVSNGFSEIFNDDVTCPAKTLYTKVKRLFDKINSLKKCSTMMDRLIYSFYDDGSFELFFLE